MDWEWEAAGGGGIASVGARGKEPGNTASFPPCSHPLRIIGLPVLHCTIREMGVPSSGDFLMLFKIENDCFAGGCG